jgi:hypothetical protein
LLLTVKNLENFAKIHETQQKSMALPPSHPTAEKRFPNNLLIENKHFVEEAIKSQF